MGYLQANKTIAPQQPFFSTCKKQKTPSVTVRLVKPKNTEKV